MGAISSPLSWNDTSLEFHSFIVFFFNKLRSVRGAQDVIKRAYLTANDANEVQTI